MLNPQLINWLLLGFLVLVWGTSFMAIAVAIQGGLGPVAITLLRIACAVIVLMLFCVAKGKKLPNNLKSWASLLLLGLFGSALPFMLISWGQQTVPSASTGVLMSIMPLVTMLLAHYLIEGERLNRFKIMGFITAFTGVFILLTPAAAGSVDFYGALAILAAATSYAFNTVLIRLLPPFHPAVAGTGMMLCSFIILLPLGIFEYSEITQQLTELAEAKALIAVIWLGLMPTGVASIIYFIVVNRAGPSFLSNCNFLIPVVAFFAGTILLNEPASLQSLIALLAILCGITLTRIRR